MITTVENVAILLYNIRSTHNVGSIFRTADAVGAKKIYISGYTPAPLDRFGRPRKDIAKVSLGGEKSVPWESVADPLKLIATLKADGYMVVALEQDARSIDYKAFVPTEKILFIVGNEVGGVEKEILDQADAIIEIPMVGEKESLNVSVAFGVALFRILGR